MSFQKGNFAFTFTDGQVEVLENNQVIETRNIGFDTSEKDFIKWCEHYVEENNMETTTKLQNLNDKLYNLANILKRKQEKNEPLTVQDLLLEEIADEMRELLKRN